MDNPSRYTTFGELLTKLRIRAGIAQQADLAALLKSSQQTISRWERGVSRPRAKQVSAIAAVLKADTGTLLAAAGYAASSTVASFEQPFPIDALQPEAFERFCLYFLAELYPNATVHREGGPGHRQDGLDINVTFPNKTRFTYQCKRVSEFGAEKVKAAIKAHTRPAKRKHLLLTRIATPKARQAVAEHKDWEIWDKEDVSRVIRQKLSPKRQISLVDTFFRGQRLALLGVPEAGPWQTPEKFFAPFSVQQGIFSHKWELVGREPEAAQLFTNLSNSNIRAVFLIGAGGSGKSRLLKHVVEEFNQKRTGHQIYFLSPTEEVTSKSLEDLGDGPKLLVVDDAHDRADLQILFQYAADSANDARIVLALRPYGVDYVRSQAINFALAGERVAMTTLTQLSLEQATELVSQVLRSFGAPVTAAKDIAEFTRDCPLAAVIGAQVAAKEKVHLEFAKNEDIFRSTLLGKFQDVIAGEIGSKSDAGLVKKVMRVLALVQPFYPEDESLIKAVGTVEQVPAIDVNRIIRLLTDAGVLFKRGGMYRLSPDLLADYIIEQACIGAEGRSTGYAEQVFFAAGDAHLEHILVNLGKLDWRRSNGDPSNSKLLDGIWAMLRPTLEYADPHIAAVTAVAYYQPVRALQFVERQMRSGTYLRQLPDIVKFAAYNFEHLPSACECLWELGKSDKRALNRHPGHAIRLLTELCAIEPNKPFSYNKTVVEFALALLNRDSSWAHAYTPFDVLKGIMHTEGHTTSSNGRSISMAGYLVPHWSVTELRERVIDATIGLLNHRDAKVAVMAAVFLSNTLRYPTGILNIAVSQEERNQWTPEFVATLKKIERAVLTQNLDPLVLIEILRSISWHEHYATGETALVAKGIVDALPKSPEFRTSIAFLDGWGHLFKRLDHEQHEQEWNRQLDALVNDLVSTYPNPKDLWNFLEKTLVRIQDVHGGGSSSQHILYWRLVQASDVLAAEAAEQAVRDPLTASAQFAGLALGKLLMIDHDRALRLATAFLETRSPTLYAAIGRAYAGISAADFRYGDKDIEVLKTILSSNDPWVVTNAIGGVRDVIKRNKPLAIQLLKHVDIGLSLKVADEVLSLFQKEDLLIPFITLSPADIDHFLTQLMRIPELDGYWIEVFLSRCSKYHAHRTAEFVISRVEHSVKLKDWQYRPCNYGPFVHVPLKFRESEEFRSLLKIVAQWMRSHTEDDFHFRESSGQAFSAMFGPLDDEVIGMLREWAEAGAAEDIEIIARILGEASHEFVFNQRDFVIRFLEKAAQYGDEILEMAVSRLFGSGISGAFSGRPGEPMPRDIKMREESEKILNGISRFTPAYRLYDALRKHAEQGIQTSLKEAERFED